MTSAKKFALASIAAAAFGYVIVFPGAKAQPADGKLVGVAAQEAVVGNTLVGTILDKGMTIIYFDADGAVRIKQDQKVDVGKWSFTATDVCFDYNRPIGPECVGFEVKGSKATIIHDGQPLGELFIVKGNAENL
jgi:hypothetical protein